MAAPIKAGTLRRLVNCWPPFLFAGIRCTRLTDDYREAEVALRLRWYNRNYVGTHFGGSLFAMTDPWYPVLLINLLGRDYIVWDKEAAIEYVSPGRGTVRARFRIDDARLQEIIERTRGGEKFLPEFTVDIVDQAGEVVARVRRTVYVRRKLRPAGAGTPEQPSPG